MTSFFNKLLRLKSNSNIIPLEDFFTEIFSYLLDSHNHLFIDWLNEFSITEMKYDTVFVGTQESFEALSTHLTSSRPDIYIELSNATEKEIIFVESKVGSDEGDLQLKRYAEQLDEFDNIADGILIYITRDYDPKNSEFIFADCKNRNRLKFKQLRWYEIYIFLQKYNDTFVNEVLKFMEENNMSLSNQFSNIDILALTNFPKVQKMMNETMNGSVSEKFSNIAKGISQSASCLTQLRDYNRYIYQKFQKNDEFWIGMGYWIEDSNITNYPKVGIVMEVSPNATHRNEIITAMTEIVKTDPEKWHSYHLTERRAWSSIIQYKRLDEFISETDHIEVIKTYLLEILDDFTDMRESYPNLPWNE